MELECIYEKKVTTKKESYSRIYLETIEFAKANFGIGQKFTYYLDLKNKKVTIIPLRKDKKPKYKGSMTRRMKEQYVPVLNIQSKDIAKVFSGISECKIRIFKNEIIVEPLNNENENNSLSTNIDEFDENSLINYKEYTNQASNFSTANQPLYRIGKQELYKFYNENGLDKQKLDDVFEFNEDPYTQKLKSSNQVKKDIPILKKTLKVLSLFSGIGAFEKGLDENNIPYELVNYCEIDEHASKAYSAIHGVSEKLNLWDITKIKAQNFLKKINLITHGSPCTDYSSCGLQKGGDEGSGTRSSLMWKTVEIIKSTLPKYVIWENVKNALSKRHVHNVDKYVNTLNELGYTSYTEVLNSNEQGVPHSRSRVFIVSILGEHKPFKFPSKIPLKISLQEFLTDNKEPGVDDDIKPGCKKEFIAHYDKIITSDAGIYDCRAKTDFQDKKVGLKYCPCLRSSSRNAHVLDRNKCIRKISMKESWELMGFGKKAYEKVKAIGISVTQMQKQIGNSIDVHVISRILKNLFCY